MTAANKIAATDLQSPTRNQHFLPRVEQKLNAQNPNAAVDNLRIYSFRVVDREAYSVELEDPKGRPIRSNLSLFDLFSFDVDDASKIRMNFEALFERYEANIEIHTLSLLAKLRSGCQDVKAEIVDLFAGKLLNFVRNPFCITKVMNTFPQVRRLDPTDPFLRNCYNRILSGKKPQQSYLCSQLGITAADYVDWLRTLFMLLVHPSAEHPNLFEGVIKSLFENPDRHVSAMVCTYDTKVCLLSDRGFCQPIPDGLHFAMSFNLTSQAFVHYSFADIEAMLRQVIPDRGALEDVKSQFDKRVFVSEHRNNMQALAAYNRRAIEQCYQRVYCASPDRIEI
jgi:hypothetical protein